MVIREWRARAQTEAAELYPRHFRANVLPHLKTIQGFVGAHLARREVAGTIEFVVLTRWASMESIRAFAGEDCETAVVEPEAIAALESYDRTVRHYDVVEET